MTAQSVFELAAARLEATARNRREAIVQYAATGQKQCYLRPGYMRLLERSEDGLGRKTWSLLRYFPVNSKRSQAALKAWKTMRGEK